VTDLDASQVTKGIDYGRWRPYLEQRASWPDAGRHILAHYDHDSIIVYQAYQPSIGHWIVEHQRFGGEWSFDRMSWIKPNFMWMMYRCGWGQKPGQEVVLAVRLAREGFDRILADAVHSSFEREHYADQSTWKKQLAQSGVRLQWDPDHDAHGQKLARRAIQLGLRGATLQRYASEWCMGIEDISARVRTGHEHVRAHRLELLETPHERVYPVADRNVIAHLDLDSLDAEPSAE
jgi:hypothetical protein